MTSLRSGLPSEQDAGKARTRKTGEITITRGTDKSTALTDWIKATLVNADLDAARQDITIVLKDAQKKTVRRVHLSNAWASRWEGAQLGASESDPAAEQVTITYEDITVA
ncbi:MULTISPECIES: phage tail protein [unclassified Streptomyces]|uniref:phage tail protein n=1 Tax=unclassified Streptomyces TaxID=2593676 RepID=UPI00332F2FB1